MEYKNLLLVINPGSTSTKIAVFDELTEVFNKVVEHDSNEIAKYANIVDQYELRYKEVINKLDEYGIKIEDLKVVIGRGGLLKPLQSGTYKVNDVMLEDLRSAQYGSHASNLGAIIAYEIAKVAGVDAYITDPVVVDEMTEVAKTTGLPEVKRSSKFHALNQKSCGRRAAKEMGKTYFEINTVIAHMGGGTTVAAHEKGRVIDVNDGLYGDGPFSSERAGRMPTSAMMDMFYVQGKSLNEVKRRLAGDGGFVAHFQTNDAYAIEQRAIAGDEQAKLVYEAMSYQVAKEIGAMAVALKGEVDVIILTGGLAHSKLLTKSIIDKVKFLADVKVYPGENEMIAMAEAAVRVIKQEEMVKEYI